jgi:DNA polymerase-3 subunit epsilon
MKTSFVNMIQRRHWLVLDTETTGLRRPAEICQIALIDADGDALLNTLVKPVRPIPPDATRIHGITNEQVADAPSWSVVAARLQDLVQGRDVIVYNVEYDSSVIRWSDEASQRTTDWGKIATWWCAMKWYAEYRGVRNPRYGGYAWHSLTNAMLQQGLPISDAHSALGDTQMTRALIQHLCPIAQQRRFDLI